MILALVLIPAAAGAAAIFVRDDAVRRALLVVTAALHAAITAFAWVARPGPLFGGWLAMDAVALLFVSITSGLFLAAAIYALGYLRREGQGHRKDFEEDVFFVNTPEAIFTGCLLLFLATMTLVPVSQHMGLLWVAVEATTLASAPLIYFHRHHRSLEATWKYLMICSVGIALALLGNFFLAVAAADHGDHRVPIIVAELVRKASQLHPTWLKAAFVLLLVGYGTKMGLAPMHTWLPDAHSEAPSVISALLSGALLNCAFVGVLRAHQVCAAAGQAAFSESLLLALGLVSMAVAAVFIFGQADYKRMLAYSSIEHVGILAVGVGLGQAGAAGSMLHAMNHSAAKAALFLVTGNILAAYRTKSTEQVRGVLRTLPISGTLWVAGFLAITGCPPFGTFLSEFSILKAALDQGRGWLAAGYLGLLALVFISMSAIVLRMSQGRAAEGVRRPAGSELALGVASPAALAAIVLLLGVYVPPAVSRVIGEAVRAIGGT